MKQYRSRPITIEAVQYTKKNLMEVCLWLGKNLVDIVMKFNESNETLSFIIDNPTGNMTINESDYIIKDSEGNFYPCIPENFNDEYEEITPTIKSIVGRVCIAREVMFNGKGEQIRCGEECLIDFANADDDPFNKYGITYTIISNNGIRISGVYRDSLELID